MPRLFTSPNLFSWQGLVLVTFILIFAVTAWRLNQQPRRLDHKTYNIYAAWLRGLLYFSGSSILAVLLGVFAKVFTQPLFTSANLQDAGWLGFTALCCAVEFVAYFIIWRAGTLPLGRALHLPSVLLFGLLWGFSEAQMFLSFWALVEMFVPSRWLVAVLSFVVISTFKGLWQSQYWDIYVSPEHNIPEWNLRKVLFAHIPNLIVTLAYLAIYENAGMFVIFQTIAILGSAYYMRFPAWTDIKPRKQEGT